MIPLTPCEKVLSTRGEIPGRVLIIDEEPLVRWSLVSGLALAGFEARGASSAAEALEIAREAPPPDIVLLDLRFYDADPLALVAEIRRAAPSCRLILLTTAGQEPPLPPWDRVAIITKPYDLPNVEKLVRATLESAA
jgi:DNA-binding NtrC family response regulator